MQKARLLKETSWLLKEEYKGKETPAFKEDVRRLKKEEPVDYLIGFLEFAGVFIGLSQKPLIPRPETEYWTLQAIEELKKEKRPLCCLDMFAGSGCIGIAVLKHVAKAQVDFAEKDKKLLGQILLNLKKNSINPRRACIIQSDIFSNLKGKYDYIFANPPYIAESRRKSVQASVLQHEPKEALFAGEDGLKHIRRFLKEAGKHLNPGGKLYLEFDSPQKKEIEKLLKLYGYSSWQFHKDQYGKWRFVRVEP